MSSPLAANNQPFLSAIWVAPFRAFYLLGASYVVLVMLLWLLTVVFPDVFILRLPLSLVHGHEMVFGFAGAIVTGFILTALPSWAGTNELRGRPLRLLALWWFCGRVAFISLLYLDLGYWHQILMQFLDASYFVLMAMLIAGQLLQIKDKRYLFTLFVLIGLALSNGLFHRYLMTANFQQASDFLYIGIQFIIVKFTIVSGILTPVFTNNELEEQGKTLIKKSVPLEFCAIGSVIALLLWHVFLLEQQIGNYLALIAALVHSARLSRWQTLNIINKPLLLSSHIAYAWLIITFTVRSLDGFYGTAWLHVFTAGAMALMMLSLMTRVVLRHTGRKLNPSRAISFSFIVLSLAAMLRVSVSLFNLSAIYLYSSAILWLLPFAVYLFCYGKMMISPSLPRNTSN